MVSTVSSECKLHNAQQVIIMNENETKKVKCLQNEHFLKGRDILPMTNKLTFKLAYYIISTYQYGAPSTLLKMEYKNMSQYSQLHMTTGSWEMWDLKRGTVQKKGKEILMQCLLIAQIILPLAENVTCHTLKWHDTTLETVICNIWCKCFKSHVAYRQQLVITDGGGGNTWANITCINMYVCQHMW